VNRSGSKCAVRGIPSVSGVSRAPCSCSAAPVEGLYCKRPIQCPASSKILTPPPPTPSPPGECVPPAFGAGGGHTRWVERGWGVNILEDARHCSVLYTYVSTLWPRPSPVPDHYITPRSTELEFLNNLWGLESSRNRVIVPARQAT
jgi:hypothetical protein